jgi:hypothetical protein
MAGNINSNKPTTTVHDTLTEAEIVNVEGQIDAGAKAVSVKNIGAGAGTFDQVAIDPGETINYPWVGSTYDVIRFNAAGTSLKIFVFR